MALTLISGISQAAIPKTEADEQKFNEIMSGRLVDCSSFKQSATPTLYFETIGPKALVNSTATQLSLQMKVVYYRCHTMADGDNGFTVVDPKSPYQYELEQIDGTLTTIKVKGQQYRFSAMTGKQKDSTDIKKGISGRVESDGLLNFVRLDLPIDQILTESQRAKLMSGNSINVNVRVVGALSTEYKIGTESQGATGFVPGTALDWKVKLSRNKGLLDAEVLKIQASSL
jgi:hypothetical protein